MNVLLAKYCGCVVLATCPVCHAIIFDDINADEEAGFIHEIGYPDNGYIDCGAHAFDRMNISCFTDCGSHGYYILCSPTECGDKASCLTPVSNPFSYAEEHGFKLDPRLDHGDLEWYEARVLLVSSAKYRYDVRDKGAGTVSFDPPQHSAVPFDQNDTVFTCSCDRCGWAGEATIGFD